MGKSVINSETGLRVKIYRSISEVGEGQWDAIVGKDRIFCTHKYIEALEKSGINEGTSYYPVVYNHDEIVAHACVYFIREEVDLFARGAIKKMFNLVRRKWKNFFIMRSLECGPPLEPLGHTISLKEGVDQTKTIEALFQGIEQLAKELHINFILFRDFYDEDALFYDLLKGRGYMKIHNLPKAKMKIRWKSFDEYLGSMRSSYRCKIIKNMDKCAKAAVSIRVLKDFSSHSHELQRLYDNVYNHVKEIKREHVAEAYFQNIDKYLGERSPVILAVKDDRPIGFMLMLFNHKTLISRFIGLDYNYNQECCTYFNIFYKAAELAIETGMDEIDMGITALNPKRDMGSGIFALNMYMKHSNPLLNKIIPVLFDTITPPDTTDPRNVFK